MSSRLYLDKRSSTNGLAPLKLALTVNRQTAYISIDVRLYDNQFEQDKNGSWRIVNHPDSTFLTNYVREFMLKVDKELLQARLAGDLVGMSATEVKDYIMSRLFPAKQPKVYFCSYYRSFNDQMHSGRTHELYVTTLERILEYDKKGEKLMFEDITPAWLQGFMNFMKSKQRDVNNPNGSNIHLRNIRAVFNHAIHADHVVTYYPFDEFAIRYVETSHRAMTVERLRAFFNTEVDEGLRRYLDYFKLMFFLRGINVIDLCSLKKSDVVDGRIEYIRAKTKKHYSIKIEPEAQELIDKYAGNGEYLLNILDTNKSYLSFSRNMDRRIKHVGEYQDADGNTIMPFADISSYYMRHSFATIQINDNREDVFTVSKGLGHQYGSKVTAVYIDFDQRKADEANRRLIDWVMYEKKPDYFK